MSQTKISIVGAVAEEEKVRTQHELQCHTTHLTPVIKEFRKSVFRTFKTPKKSASVTHVCSHCVKSVGCLVYFHYDSETSSPDDLTIAQQKELKTYICRNYAAPAYFFTLCLDTNVSQKGP